MQLQLVGAQGPVAARADEQGQPLDLLPHQAPFAGQAGGRIHSGLHVAGNSDPVSSVALTAMQVMGVAKDSFGTGAMQTKKTIGEIIV